MQPPLCSSISNRSLQRLAIEGLTAKAPSTVEEAVVPGPGEVADGRLPDTTSLLCGLWTDSQIGEQSLK